ncbi:Amino acid transporter [Gryllus bimaculatus]|nr:Amino acid transporter [Gryllus bimaculatus]
MHRPPRVVGVGSATSPSFSLSLSNPFPFPLRFPFPARLRPARARRRPAGRQSRATPDAAAPEPPADYIERKMAPGATCGGGGGGGGGGVEARARRPARKAAPGLYGRARRWLAENLLLLATVAGVVVGVLLGFALRPLDLGPDAILLVSYPGELVMRLLKLMILPLIIASLVSDCRT